MSGYLLLILVVSLLPLCFLFPAAALLLYNFLNYASPQEIVYSPFGAQSYSLWAGAMLLFSFILFENKSLRYRATFVVFMVMFTAWILVTTQYAQGISGLVAHKQDRVVKTLLVATLAVFILSSRERIEALLLVLLVSIASSGFLHGVRAIVGGGSYGLVENFGKVYQESSVLSMLMIIGIIIILYIRKHSVLIPKLRFLNLIYLILSGLMLACLIGVHARTGLVCLAVFVVIQTVKSKKKLVGIALLALAVAILPSMLPESFTARIGTVDTFGQDNSATSRVDAWIWGWELAQKNPIFGGGFSVYESLHGYAAHNWFFEILGEHGFVGIAIFLFLMSLAYLGNRKTKRVTKGIPEYQWAHDLAGTINFILIIWFTGGLFTGVGFASLHYDLAAASVGLSALIRHQLGEQKMRVPSIRAMNTPSLSSPGRGGQPIPAAKH